MNRLFSYFKSKFSLSLNNNFQFLFSKNTSNPIIYKNIIDCNHFKRALSSLKSPAIGPDLIPIIFFKKLSLEIINHIIFLFNLCLANTYCPTQWQFSFINPILKHKKDENLPSSYRPISVTSAMLKIFEKIILQYLAFHLQNRLSPNQH